MPGGGFPGREETRVTVTDQDNDVTTTIAGANGFETIWDLSPDTNIYYYLLEEGHSQLGAEGNPRIRMQLPQDDGGSTEIGDNAKIRLVARSPETDDTGDKLGRVFRYRRFTNADQYDEDDVVRLTFEDTVLITEAAHLEIQVDNSTNGNDVDLSQSGGFAELEAHRGVEKS